jgi:hypothetical protein
MQLQGQEVDNITPSGRPAEIPANAFDQDHPNLFLSYTKLRAESINFLAHEP